MLDNKHMLDKAYMKCFI